VCRQPVGGRDEIIDVGAVAKTVKQGGTSVRIASK